MNSKKLLGGTLAASSIFTMLVLSTTVYTAASAVEADTDSSIPTEELCTWYMLGAPTAITLEPADNTVEYEGDAINVSDSFSGDNNLNVYTSGNVNAGSRTTHSECTFYSDPAGADVTVALDGTAFTATAQGDSPSADTAMNFSAQAGNPLALALTGSCDALWSSASPALSSTTATSILSMAQADVKDRVATTTAGDNDRCGKDLAISINIPAGMTPTYPGVTYAWAGPTLTTTLTTD